MIVRTDPQHLSTDKGQAISKFIYYAVCAGQQKAVGNSGYSPLPRQLVQAAFDATRLMPGAGPPPAIATCQNPTITGQFSRGTGGSSLPPPASAPGGTKSGSGAASGLAAGSSQVAAGQQAGGSSASSGNASSASATAGADSSSGVTDSAALGQGASEALAAIGPLKGGGAAEGGTWVLVFAGLGLILLVLAPAAYAAFIGPGMAHEELDLQQARAAVRRQAENDNIVAAMAWEASGQANAPGHPPGA
jgi:hypothetical protein